MIYLRKNDILNQEGEALTPRDKEIIKLIAWGHTSKEISKMSNISDRTVESIQTKIRKILKAKNNSHLVYLAYKMDLL